MNHLSRWRAIAITPLAVLCMTSAIAQAEFVPIFPSFERQDSFDRDYKWNFVSPTTREDGKIWFTTLTDKLNPDFSHDLTATIRHTVTGPLFTLSFNGLKQPVLGKTDILAEAQQANHGAGASYFFFMISTKLRRICMVAWQFREDTFEGGGGHAQLQRGWHSKHL